ncbi:MAG: alpha/beta fold hydrolase [Pseudomonadota bacterium]
MTTLVLVPGLGSDVAVWARTITALGDGVQTQVGDTLRDASLADMARRILAAAPETFVLAGVSMGGMVSMEIMRIAPGRVKALALVDTNARPDTDDQKARRLAINAAMLAASDIRTLGGSSLDYLVHRSAPRSVREELTDMTVRVGAETYVRQNLAVAAREDLRPALPAITVPTQVIVGAEDRMTPPELSHEIHALIPGAELHTLDDCGHLPPIEKPEETARLLRALLARAG